MVSLPHKGFKSSGPPFTDVKDDEARDYLSSRLVKDGSSAATGYQGDDDDDDVDDDLNHEADDPCIHEEDDCSVTAVKAQIEESSDDDYGCGPYWESSCATQYLDFKQ